MGFNIFSFITGLISPLITLLFGYLLIKPEDIINLINPKKGEMPYLPSQQKTIKLIKLIGMLMLILGGLRLLGGILKVIGSILSLFGIY